jgi:DnaJ-class molecular chaperone
MDNKDLYGLLGVPRNASGSEIKRAYHDLAKKHHPDKNPTEEDDLKFKEIQKAYEILRDSEKRNLYDQFGMDAFRDGGMEDMFGGMGGFGGFSSMFGGGDMFSSFFGGDMMARGGRRRAKPETLAFPLELVLHSISSCDCHMISEFPLKNYTTVPLKN